MRQESRDSTGDTGFFRELAEVLVGIKKATKVFLAYGRNHPARAQALDRTHKQVTNLLAQRAPLSLRVGGEGFFCDDVRVGRDHPLLQGFGPELVLRGIQAIRLLPGIRLDDLQHLTELLTTDAADVSCQGGSRAFLQARGASTVEVEDLDMKFIESASPRPEPVIHQEGIVSEAPPRVPSDPTDEETVRRPAGKTDAEGAEPADAEEPKLEEAPPDLEALIRELRETDRPARYEYLTEELSRWGHEAVARGEDETCLRIMSALALELRPDSSKDEKVTRYARWTLRSMLDEIGPHFLIEGFCRSEAIPEGDLVHLLLTLKEEIAGPAVDRLLSEEGTAARRKLADLLIQMGEVSLPAVRSALEAPSWETARRLFPLLPKLAAPDAVEILKRLFRHADPLIRRESIRLFGQMGTEATPEPVLGALSDPDASVRQAAMAILSGMKAKAAVPLLQRIAQELPGTRDLEEQKMAIAALGAIGDPEALPTLLTVLRRKSWLSRRRTEELREAAAYALGALGGTEAVETLRAVAHAAPPALRRACEAALRGAHDSHEPEGTG